MRNSWAPVAARRGNHRHGKERPLFIREAHNLKVMEDEQLSIHFPILSSGSLVIAIRIDVPVIQ